MPKNRIKSLRKKEGMSGEELAEKVGITQGHISRIESGTRGLSLALAEKIAMALNTDIPSVLGIGQDPTANAAATHGLTEDAEPYKAGPEEPLILPKVRGQNVDPWRVKTDALDLAGIRRYDVVLVDISAEAVDRLQPLQIVIAQLYNAKDLSQTVTIVRQFVPPTLLITNSSQHNELPLRIDHDDVVIKGVIVSQHRTLMT